MFEPSLNEKLNRNLENRTKKIEPYPPIYWQIAMDNTLNNILSYFRQKDMLRRGLTAVFLASRILDWFGPGHLPFIGFYAAVHKWPY